MDLCDDSPVKKKRKSNKQNKNLKCIIHVKQNEKGTVTKFGDKSWTVR